MNAKRQQLKSLLQLFTLSALSRLGGLSLMVGSAFSVSKQANAQALERESEDFRVLFKNLTQSSRVTLERVHVSIPRLADNGHSVPLKVWVDGPQNVDDHVKRLVVLSERNPRPMISSLQFSPTQTRLEFSSRIRLNGSQRIWVLALMSDDTWWGQVASVEVTESACLDASL
jgi:sulfur-oxidizing protein SoxY